MEKEQEKKEEQKQTLKGFSLLPVEAGTVWGVPVQNVLGCLDWFFTSVPGQMLIDLHEKVLEAAPQAKKDGNYLALFNEAREGSPLRGKMTPEQIRLVDARLIWSFLFIGGDFNAVRETFKAAGIDPKEAFTDREKVEKEKEEESLSA